MPKGIYRGLLFGSITKSKDPSDFVPKRVVYGDLQIKHVDVSAWYAPGTKGTKWKTYFIDGHQVEPSTVQKVKMIPEDYEPFKGN